MYLYNQYRTFLLSIANCGFTTEYISSKHFQIDLSESNPLIKQDLIAKRGIFMLFGKSTTIYTLTDNGKSIISDYSKALYKSDNNQLEHDYLLLKVFSLLPADAQVSWQNETELKAIYNANSCDGIFKFNNKIIGVEIITPNYTKLAINERMTFINTYCDDFITINSKDIKV